MDVTCYTCGEIRNTTKMLILRTEGKRPYKIRRCQWVYRIEEECREMGCKVVVQM